VVANDDVPSAPKGDEAKRRGVGRAAGGIREAGDNRRLRMPTS